MFQYRRPLNRLYAFVGFASVSIYIRFQIQNSKLSRLYNPQFVAFLLPQYFTPTVLGHVTSRQMAGYTVSNKRDMVCKQAVMA